MATKVKICGITDIEDALDAIELGADYLGFHFSPDLSHFVVPEVCQSIIHDIPTEILKVGVFENADPQYVIDLATAFDLSLLQFHGDETPAYCKQFARPYMKVFKPKNKSDLSVIPEFGCEYILIDSYVETAYGGTGILSNWDLSRDAKEYAPVFLSGGLKPDNVEIAVHAVKPFAVNVITGVESSKGKKDYRKMEEFIKRAKGL